MDSNVETTNMYTHPELLVVADTVAREKGINREEVLDAMEQAIQKAGRSKYGHEHDIRAEIDRKSGEILVDPKFTQLKISKILVESRHDNFYNIFSYIKHNSNAQNTIWGELAFGGCAKTSTPNFQIFRYQF